MFAIFVLHQRPNDSLQFNKVRPHVVKVFCLLTVENLEKIPQFGNLKSVPGNVGIVIFLEDNVHGPVEKRVKLELKN